MFISLVGMGFVLFYTSISVANNSEVFLPEHLWYFSLEMRNMVIETKTFYLI